MRDGSLKVLLVEDNPGDARLIGEMLNASNGFSCDLECTGTLSGGLERLSKGDISLALLDLNLPDSRGIETLSRLLEQAPQLPVVVLTGLEDKLLSMEALRLGAQDYLPKDRLDGDLLVRSLHYAVERHRLKQEVAEVRQQQQRQRELLSLEKLTEQGDTAVASRLYGRIPMRQSAPETFAGIVRQYAELLDRALEQRAYRAQHNISEGLRAIGEGMGLLKAGPRDVVDVHTAALRERSRNVEEAKAQAYVEEGRLMVLQMMGYLAAFYRRRAVLRTSARFSREASYDRELQSARERDHA